MRTRSENMMQRIKPVTRQKLVFIAGLDRRSAVEQLDVLMDEELRRRGYDPAEIQDKSSTRSRKQRGVA